LEDRRLLVAAIDLASISGRVFDDASGNGFNAGEEVANAVLDLYRDDGDGVFEPEMPGGDTPHSMAMSDANGIYKFNRLTAGNYFVLQPAQTASGKMLQRSVSPLITISGEDVKGQVTTPIDSFNQTEQTVTDLLGDGTPVTSPAAAPEAIGNQRDLFVNKTSQDGSVQITVNGPTLRNRVSIRLDDTAEGQRRIIWDGGGDDPATISDNGLGGINLAQNAEGVQFQVRADLEGGNAVIRVYSDDGVAGTASRFSTATLRIPVTTGNFLSPEFLSFSNADFVATSGGGADFSNVGAIELEITGAPDTDVTASLLAAVGTTVRTADFANFERADLSLTKTVDDPTPNINQQVRFTITVNNAGPDLATGVVVTDVLPPGINFVSASSPNYNSANGQWTVGSINNGGTASLIITGVLATPGAKTNTAQITAADQLDPDSDPNTNTPGEDDQASVTVSPEQIDLSLSKTVNNATPNVGQEVVFTVSVTNAGPSPATNVTVRDTLPNGVALVSAVPTGGSFNTATGVWTIPTLAVGQTLNLPLTVRVNSPGMITNTAEVIGADQDDVNSEPNNNNPDENDQASVSLITPTADLSLTKEVNNAAPNVDEQVTFTITVNNEGPNPASGVEVLDLLPAGLSFVSATTTAGQYNGDTGIWTIGAVGVGATPTLSLFARVNSDAPSINTARVLKSDQFDPDSTPGNSAASEDDQASVTVDPPTIDLSLTKTIDNSRPNVGDEVLYTVTLSNASGFDMATGIVVRDSLPDGVTYLSDSPASGSYSEGTGQWTVPMLAAGSSTSLLLRGRVNGAGATTNTAEVIDQDQFDRDSEPNNNAPTEDDQASVAFALASADLSLTKTVDKERPNIGDDVTFTVTLRNAGPDSATNISVRDQLPIGTRFVSANPSQGEYENGTGIWTIPNLRSGGSATLRIVATADSTTLATNTAEIIAADQDDPDSEPGNGAVGEDDLATAQVQGQQIDLSLTNRVSNPLPAVGEEVTFTITVRNDGVSGATGVVVSNPFPAGVSLRSNRPSQGSFNTSTRRWSVGALAVGQQATLELVARVDRAIIEPVASVAQVTAADQPDFDSMLNNNVESEDDQESVFLRTPVADLSLTKSVSDATPNVGEQISFDVRLQNDGPDLATGIIVTDLLPSGLQFVSTSLTDGTYDATTGAWAIGSLASGDFALLTINAMVENEGQKKSTARVTKVDQADPDSKPGNNVESEDDQQTVNVTPLVIDLSLAVTAAPQRPSIGETLTFTLTVTNGGPNHASGVTVADNLPAGLTLVSADTASGSYDPLTGIWNIGDLPLRAKAVLVIEVTVDDAEVKTYTAEISAADQFDSDSVPGNAAAGEDDLASVMVTPANADLSLTKTIDKPEPNVGERVNFTLTVANAGPDPSGPVTILDQLPTGMTFVSASPSAAYNPTTNIWSVNNIPPRSSAKLRILATVDTIGEKTNRAEILTASQFDPDSVPGNNDPTEDDWATVSLTPQLVDLALKKLIDVPTPNVGDTIEYLLELSNEGPTRATGVDVTDRLPPGVVFKSATASQGSYSSKTGIWKVGTVAVGSKPTLKIKATVGNTRGETNTAQVTAADQADVDSRPDNNMPSEDDQATVEFRTQVADLSLTKTVDNPTPDRNETVTFQLTLSNAGPDDATAISVRDVLPQGLRFVAATPNRGAYDAVSGLWTLPNLPHDSSATLDITARVVSAIGTDNTAEVIAVKQFDPNSTPGNGNATEDDIALAVVTPPVADLSVSATVDNPEPLVDDIIEMTFSTANGGPVDATGVAVKVPIDTTGLTLLSVQPQTGTYDLATGRWTIGGLASGTTTNLLVRAQVDARGFKQIPMEVVESDQFDIDSIPGNQVTGEDDQTELIIRAPRLLTLRLFFAR
jgi:uncharacterized repeat protein (TIGR01451 family)